MRSDGLLHDFRRHFLLRIGSVPTSVLEHYGRPELVKLAGSLESVRSDFEAAAVNVVGTLSRLGADGRLPVQPSLQRALYRSADSPVGWLGHTRNVRLAVKCKQLKRIWVKAKEYANMVVGLAAEWDEVFKEQVALERAALRTALHYPDIQNGIEYSSDGLRSNLEGYVNSTRHFKPGRLRKLEEALSAYVGRAAAKTSPFSTFTILGWGDWVSSGPHVCELPTRGRRTLVRMERAAINRLAFEVIQQCGLDESMVVRVNPTLDEVDGVWHFYRVKPQLHDSTFQFIGYTEELVKMPSTAAGRWVLRRIRAAEGGRTLVGALGNGSSLGELADYVEKMVDLQLVEVTRPLPESVSGYDEAVLCGVAESKDAEFAAMGTTLRDACRDLAAYGDASLEERRTIRRRVDRAWQSVEESRGIRQGRGLRFFEDVAYRGNMILDERLISDVREDLLSLGRLSALFQPAYRIRARLASLVAREFDGEAPLLTVFERYQQSESKDNVESAERALNLLQARARSAIRDAVSSIHDGLGVDCKAAMEAIGPLPGWVDEPDSMAFLIQRAGSESAPWVVNLPVDGNGRYFSRFLPLFPRQLRASAAPKCRGDSCEEIVDLGAWFSANVNVHPPMTRRCIDYPAHTHDPDWARIKLTEMRVVVSDSGALRVRDGNGKTVFPTHLGFLVFPWLSHLARFLSSLGTVGPKPLPWHDDIVRRSDNRRHVPRLYWGRLLLYRERWNLSTKDLAPWREGSDIQAMAAVERLREKHGMPLQAFVTVDRFVRERSRKDQLAQKEPGSGRGDNLGRKPHFVDFSSPLFLPRIRRLASSVTHSLAVEEIYPPLNDTLVRSADGCHAVELLVEV